MRKNRFRLILVTVIVLALNISLPSASIRAIDLSKSGLSGDPNMYTANLVNVNIKNLSFPKKLEELTSQSNPSDPAGSSYGEFSVSPNGAAMYTIPIGVPPGTHGVQPDLSLIYNSQQGNGILGMGWSLSGISSISRCGANRAEDGYVGGINFDTHDRFCLDGIRLIAVQDKKGNYLMTPEDREQAYGQDGTVYHTQKETWTKIVSRGQCSSGPCFFDAWNKDGWYLEFGTSPDSAVHRSSTQPDIFAWNIHRTTDLNGNYVSVSYIAHNGINLLQTINYTGNGPAGLEPQRSIKFGYENRTDTINTYVAGIKLEQDQRLSSITTYVSQSLVKTFQLSYENDQQGGAAGRSRLTSIAECDGKGVCLPATTFDWLSSELNIAPTPGEFWVTNNPTPPNLNFINNTPGGTSTIGDFNGDGLTDIAISNNGWSTVPIYSSNGDGSFAITNISIPDNQNWINQGVATHTIGGDFNGDGLTDMLLTGIKNMNSIPVYFSNGDGSFTITNVSIPQATNRIEAGSNVQVIPGDFNGDGKTDIALAGGDTPSQSIPVYFSNGDGSFTITNVSIPDNQNWINNATTGNNQNYQIIEGDFNGDGLTDITVTEVPGLQSVPIYFSKGDGSFDISNMPLSEDNNQLNDPAHSQHIYSGDFNGDGRTDLAVLYSRDTDDTYVPEDAIRTYFSNGDGSFQGGYPVYYPNKTSRIMIYTSRIMPGDFNGDGMTDFLLAQGSQSGSGNTVGMYLSYGSGRYNFININLPGGDGNLINSAPSANITTGDFNGDGITDVALSGYQTTEYHEGHLGARVYPGRQTVISWTTIPVYLSARSGKAAENDLISSITNGLNGMTRIQYAPLTDPRIYKKSTSPSPYRTRQGAGSMMVVSSYSAIPNITDPANWQTCSQENNICNSDSALVRLGIGNYISYPNNLSLNCPTTLDPGDSSPCSAFIGQKYTYNYIYSGARVSLDGHGWLGFETVEMDDINSPSYKRSIVTYRQDFPFNGQIDHSEIDVNVYEVWQPLVTTQLRHSYITPYPGKNPVSCPYSAYPSCGVFQILTVDDLTANYSINYAQSTLSFQLDKQYQFDSYGNANLIADLGSSDDPGDDVFTCVLYDNDPKQWQLGYIAQKRVTSNRDDCNNFLNASPDQVPGPEKNWSASDLRWEKTIYDSPTRNILSQASWYQQLENDAVPSHWSGENYVYDRYGNIEGITDTAGFTTKISYDRTSHTFPVEELSPQIQNSWQTSGKGEHRLTTLFQYDPRFGVLRKVNDPNGNIKGQEVDGFGRIVGATGPNLSSISGGSARLQEVGFAYDQTSGGFYTQINTRPDWKESDHSNWYYSQSYVDGMLRNYKNIAQGPDQEHSIISQRTFDMEGRVENESLPYYQNDPVPWTHIDYDLHNNPERIKMADLTFQEFSYDHTTGTITSIDGGQSRTTRVLDSRGQTIKKVSPNGLTTNYQYNPLEELKSITIHSDRGDMLSTVTHDSLGRERILTNPDTGTLTLHYDQSDRLDYQTDGNGQKTSFTYDEIGRVLSKTTHSTNSTTETTTFTYDDPAVVNGQSELTAVAQTDGTAQVNYRFAAYTAYGDVATVQSTLDNTQYTQQYSYDSLRRISQIIYPDGAVFRPTYGAGGYLQTLTLAPDGHSPFKTYATYSGYTAQNQPQNIVYGNGATLSNQYYPLPGKMGGQMSDSALTLEKTGTISKKHYTWNGLHQITDIDAGGAVKSTKHFDYTQDGMERLEKAEGPYGENGSQLEKEYNYDLTGNITRKNDVTYTYAEGSNQIKSASNGLTLQYDGEGNVKQKILEGTTWDYSYNGDNRLTEVQKDKHTVERYAYNFAGERWKKTETIPIIDGEVKFTTYYVSPYYEVTVPPDGIEIHTKYVQSPDGPVAVISTKGPKKDLSSLIRANNDRAAYQLASPATYAFLEQVRDSMSVFISGSFQTLPAITGLLTLLLVILLFRKKIKQTSYLRRHPYLGRLLLPFLMCSILFGQGGIALGALNPTEIGPGYPEAGETLYLYHDLLGSTSIVMDDGGQAVSSIDYMPYGEINQNNSAGEDTFRPKFSGKEWDSAAQLYAFGNRYYDPDLGQFTRPDPAGQFFSPYLYGNDDPENFIDPDGNFAFLIAMIIIGVITGAYFGGVAVNNGDFNPAHWDWKSGKTYGGIFGGAVIGGLGGAAGAGLAEAGVGVVAGIAGEAAIGAGENAAFTAMGGGSAKDILESAAIGAAAGAMLSVAARGIGAAGSRIFSRFASRSARIAEAGEEVSGEVSETEQSCRFSFPAGTTVRTDHGEVPIEQIRAGNHVWARNESDKTDSMQEVNQTFTRTADGLIVMTLSNGDEISATPEHPFYVEGKGWEQLADIRPGDAISTLDGKDVEVTRTTPDPGSVQVYNFEVNQDHNYFVGPDGLWVHNVRCISQTRINGKKKDVITSTMDANGSTGTGTNQNVRKFANNGTARIPKRVRSELYELDPAGNMQLVAGMDAEVDNLHPGSNGRWDAGHITGKNNGGSGTDIKNIFPQDPHVNRGEWRDYEATITDHVNNHPGILFRQVVRLYY